MEKRSISKTSLVIRPGQLYSMIRRPNLGRRGASTCGKVYGRDKLISQEDVHVDHVRPPPPPPPPLPPHHHHHHVIPFEVPVIEPHSSSDVAHEMQSESVPENIVPHTIAVNKPRCLRGVTRGIQAENDPELRPLCLINDNSFVTEKARNKCGPILKSHINEPWVLWKQVPEDVFEGCWEEFSACFRFREGENEKVKKVFRNHYKKLYSKWLSIARREAHKKAHTSEMCDALKPHNPSWLSQQVWSEMIDVWKEQAWKSKSAASKNNRAKLIVYHTGGSAPFSKHMMDLKTAKKRPPTLVEVWDRTHKKKQGNGPYINARAKEIATEYSAKVGGPAEDGTPEIDDIAIWSEITGGTKKNRILGFLGYRARDLLGPPPIVPPSIGYSSPQQSIDPKVLESMVDKIVLHRLGIESMDDASTDDSMPQSSVGININERITKMVEAKFTNFLQTFINYESIEHEVYRPNVDFLEQNDDEVDLT